ncbi:hypothetical protein [Streptomyces sp. BE133]|uniref:hypothetical protein n=1 Tax=Streptomyces sp. BE133 TaxID=3002523 RepID=UPI002E77B108|nr:hypothetical protein [Streptomyces sp. BE133]MEE1811018.1 hypothetical protein [Streptomyces sp. BE133]
MTTAADRAGPASRLTVCPVVGDGGLPGQPRSDQDDQLQAPGSPRSPLRQALLGELARRRATPAEIIRRTGSGPVPAPYAQTRLWLVSQLEEGAWAYHVPLPVHLGGRLDAGRRPAA